MSLEVFFKPENSLRCDEISFEDPVILTQGENHNARETGKDTQNFEDLNPEHPQYKEISGKLTTTQVLNTSL